MEDIQYNNLEVVLIGASGLGREIVSWNSISKEVSNKLNIIGFLDDNPNALNNYKVKIPIFGPIDFNSFDKKKSIVIAISDCLIKQTIFNNADEKDIKITTFIGENVLIGERTSIGKGSVLLPSSLVSCDTIIGSAVIINSGSQIGHDVVIGDFTSIMANVDIGGGAIIGKNVFIGTGAVILPGVIIPDNTRIGAGSIVIKSLKQSGTYFGNPVKKIF
jgi:sugar O-acyltransferase (sialic acid O-acetyltransferase NeuD family)